MVQTKPPTAVPSPSRFGDAAEAPPVPSSVTERRFSALSVTLHNDNDVTHSVVFKKEENERMKYECPLVKKLREVQVRIW